VALGHRTDRYAPRSHRRLIIALYAGWCLEQSERVKALPVRIDQRLICSLSPVPREGGERLPLSDTLHPRAAGSSQQSGQGLNQERQVPQKEQAMYATVRRYEGVTDPAEAARRVAEGFVPLISRGPGFVAYYTDSSFGRMSA
jgi:hypothetical protein